MRAKIVLGLLFFTGLVSGSHVAAQEPSGQADKWEYVIEAYLWGANIDTTTPAGTSSEIRFTDLARDLDVGLMAVLAARRGKWMLALDVIYLDVEDDIKDNLLPGVQLKTLGLEAWIVTPMVGYQVLETEKLTLNLLAGARYLWLEAPLKFEFSAPLPPGQRKSSESASIWDGVVGVRGQWKFTDKWYASYHVDVGTGDSDHTWQWLVAAGYRFDRFDAVFGYRYLDWGLDDDAPVTDLNLSGVMAGVKFLF